MNINPIKIEAWEGIRWVTICLLLTPFILLLDVSGQKLPTENELKLRIWRQRVDELKTGIVQDSSAVNQAEQALYLALLAKVLLKVDESEAKGLLAKAAAKILGDLEEDEKNRPRNLKLAQKVIQLSYEIDEGQANRLVSGLAKLYTDKAADKYDNSEMFATLARLLVEKDAQLAYQFGVQSLKYGSSQQIARLSFDLLRKDSSLGEDLYKRALQAARNNYGYEFIGSLGGYIFTSSKDTQYSVFLQRLYLELLADYLAGAVVNPADRSRCEIVRLITPFLSKLDELIQPRALAVRQGLEICLDFTNSSTAGISKGQISGDEPTAPDEFIRAAKETNDSAKKGHYYYRAIATLADGQNYDRIISLLDEMTEAEKNAFNLQNWLSVRTDYATKAAYLAFQNKDLSAYYRILSKCPNSVRPYVRFRLVRKLSPVSESGLFLENLEEIQKEISSLDVLPRESAGNFLALAELYLKVRPTDAEKMFREAVKSINKTDSDNPDFLPEKDFAPLRDSIAMSYKLLEIDEMSILSSFSNISSRRSRVRLKLGLIESSVQRHEEFRKKVQAEKLAASRK